MMIKSPINTQTQQTGQLQTENIKVACINGQLLPADKLKVVRGEIFGRNIQANIQRIKDSRRPLRLKLRNKYSVVIIDNESYEELLSLKAKFVELLGQMTQSDITALGNQLDEMFSRISASQTASRFKSLRLASPEEFSTTYKPGETERD